MPRWSVLLFVFVLILPLSAQEATEAPAIPEPLPPVQAGAEDITNILLIGSATEHGSHDMGLTDTLMVVSVNRETEHVAVVSIPRDLYVYAEGQGMVKINQIYFLAEQAEPGSGMDALRTAITYNLGLAIDYYARVDFDEFSALVDWVGGIEIAVDCTIEDWRLKEPELDKHDPQNWEMFTLWAGWHWMDGDLALWYVRSRRTSNDLDRGRRQQDVLRALWREIRADGLLENFPELWEQFNRIVETDLTLSAALGFLPLATALEPAAIETFTFRVGTEIEQGYTPGDGRFVFYPQREAIIALMQEVVTPPNTSRLAQGLPTALVYNASGIRNLHYLAAQHLERAGILASVTDAYSQPRQYNRVVDHTGNSKNSRVPVIQDVLYITDEGVGVEPDPQREYDYEVYIGNQYQFWTCPYPVIQPEYTETAESEP